MGQLKVGDRIVGIKVRTQVIKNRMGPPLRCADFDIFFDRGIDNYGGWLAVMKDNKIVKQAGAWYEYTDIESGEVMKFQSKDFPKMLQNEVLKDQIYRRICEETILQYKINSNSEEVEVTTDETNESD
jgi:recombination protein RecA